MPRILLVDDDATHRSLLQALLERDSYEMHEVRTAEEALTVGRAIRPDLMLTDLSLPGMNGLQLVRRFKGDPELRRIRILMISGHAMPEDAEVARLAGCDAYLAKPVEGSLLRAEIARLLRSS